MGCFDCEKKIGGALALTKGWGALIVTESKGCLDMGVIMGCPGGVRK